MTFQFLINSLTTGGAERVAATLVGELAKRHRILFYGLEKDCFYDISGGVAYRPLSRLSLYTPYWIKLAILPLLFFRYLNLTRRNAPDLLLSFLELSNFINIMVGKTLRKPVVISVRIHPGAMYPRRTLYGILHRALIRCLYPKASRIVVVSEGIKRCLVRDFKVPSEKMEVIPNPHPLELYRAKARAPLSPAEEAIFRKGPVFINMGRLTFQKGQWFLIRAFRKMVDECPDARLVILGDGELRDKLEELVRNLGLEGRVHFLGVQRNPFKFLARAHCFVFTSLWEGLPNVLIEALAIGVPVISVDCPSGPREILCPEVDIEEKLDYPYYGSFGILCSPLPQETIWEGLEGRPFLPQEEELSSLMLAITKDKGLRTRYMQGFLRSQDFEWRSVIDRWERVLERAVC
ncbi:glycosyltransferase [Thermosulfurimonas dismutans]|uniref:Alpha-1,4-N-acetylgalactosamine transferase PglJ n=1 Tax=Thermosulfurimonas dismutans TaxID=999894 RepID=A0A179D4Z4_9BACT|nr:glycosyltransferase [Thermosulfurimonas dismutans]OAQ21127.1 Alpha-1,4-N-acetylgalactosamine transferase PglJ [Thermosulfurimonas dismutans]